MGKGVGEEAVGRKIGACRRHHFKYLEQCVPKHLDEPIDWKHEQALADLGVIGCKHRLENDAHLLVGVCVTLRETSVTIIACGRCIGCKRREGQSTTW